MEDLSLYKIDINILWKIITELHILWRDLPRKADNASQRLEEIISYFPPEDEVKDIPFVNEEREKIQSIIESIKYSFEDDDTIGNNSEIANRIEKVCTELEIFVKFDYLRDVLIKFENRMQQIDCVFPPNHFDFRGIIADLNKEILPQRVIERLTESISYFNEGNFENAIETSAKASELLTDEFIKFLGKTPQSNWWRNLQDIYTKLLSDASSPSNLKWFIWSLLNTHHKMRVAHDTETQQIADYMDQYRKHMRTSPEWARISVICALQAAKEFQELKKIDGAIREGQNNAT